MQIVWFSQALCLASLTEMLAPLAVIAFVSAASVGGVVLWMTNRRWEPAMRQLALVVDREIHQAERAADALSKSANAQIKRVWRQAASVHDAIGGVHELHAITTELEQQASDLRQMAHMLNDSQGYNATNPGIAQHAVTSAKQLAVTAERTRETYRRLLTSVNQLVTESEGIRSSGEDAERHAQELTGMVERVRAVVHEHRPAHEARSPRGVPAPEARRKTRSVPERERWEGWSGEAALVRAEDRDSGPRRPAPRRDEEFIEPAPRQVTRSRRPNDEGRYPSDAPAARTTRRREPEPQRVGRAGSDWEREREYDRDERDYPNERAAPRRVTRSRRDERDLDYRRGH